MIIMNIVITADNIIGILNNNYIGDMSIANNSYIEFKG